MAAAAAAVAGESSTSSRRLRDGTFGTFSLSRRRICLPFVGGAGTGPVMAAEMFYDHVDLTELLTLTNHSVLRFPDSGLVAYASQLTFDDMYAWSGCGSAGEDAAVQGAVLGRTLVWAAPCRLGASLSADVEALERLLCWSALEGGHVEDIVETVVFEWAAGNLQPVLARSEVPIRRVLLLDEVHVHPTWQGIGLGRHLAAQALWVAGAFDPSAVVLTTIPDLRSDGSHPFLPAGGEGSLSVGLLSSLEMMRVNSNLWAVACSDPGLGRSIGNLDGL